MNAANYLYVSALLFTIGAVGVSGVKSADDAGIARAGIAAILS